ncbi:PREDICTED: cell adhesion molecule 3-like [Nicrophorus vespilloides]|uniref:Cell adhesion molecule 3-like n=1 Tax=Nicrophorus vespilloides TaxID=110193 RepID=A0ABM1MY61_NICVS|nr:PREDICTED: cell adhesion molecule 3-like [Nicrophorus vespilloides]
MAFPPNPENGGIYVIYTPSFAISREPGFGFPIREGMPVSLKCDVDANPKAAPIWQKDDTDPPVQQTPDGFLNFTEIRREHSGWYKCISRHLLGRFSSIGYFLNVRYDMEVTQEPDFDIGELSSTGRQLEVALGGAVQLACPPGR